MLPLSRYCRFHFQYRTSHPRVYQLLTPLFSNDFAVAGGGQQSRIFPVVWGKAISTVLSLIFISASLLHLSLQRWPKFLSTFYIYFYLYYFIYSPSPTLPLPRVTWKPRKNSCIELCHRSVAAK